MKRILAVYYSQTGQLGEIMDSIVTPLRASLECSVTVARVTPVKPYGFPWSFWGFFDTLPECIYDDPPPIEKLPLANDAEFDLIILGYQVWFISPSLPTTAFLQSEQAKRVFTRFAACGSSAIRASVRRRSRPCIRCRRR